MPCLRWGLLSRGNGDVLLSVNVGVYIMMTCRAFLILDAAYLFCRLSLKSLVRGFLCVYGQTAPGSASRAWYDGLLMMDFSPLLQVGTRTLDGEAQHISRCERSLYVRYECPSYLRSCPDGDRMAQFIYEVD